MNLIDNYVSEIGKRLPRNSRVDIEAEISSALQDILDERSKTSGKPVDDELTFEVLKEYGSPEKVAASYMPERSLIGPLLYPVFLKVVRIAFPAIAILAGFGALINASLNVASVENIAGVFVSVFVGVATTSISVLGSLVLIFALIEWVMRNEGLHFKDKVRPTQAAWDPHSLTRVFPPNQVRLADTIIEIVGCFAAIIIFNFYLHLIGFGILPGGGWYVGAGIGTISPLFSEAFLRYIPYLSAVWVLTIVLDAILLRQGTWTTRTRFLSIALKVLGILITASLLFRQSLIGLTPAGLAAVGFPASLDDAGTMIFSLNQFVRLVLLLAILVGGFDVIKTLLRLPGKTTRASQAGGK